MREQKRRWWTLVAVALVAAGGMVGCASVNPYQDALYRYGVAGQHIIEDIPAPTTPGAQARLDAFREACAEAVKLGGER